MIISLFWISLSLFGELRALEEPLIITGIRNKVTQDSSCKKRDKTFEIEFLKIPTENALTFETQPTMFLHSNKNGDVKATCEDILDSTILECTFNDDITYEDDFYFVNMTIPGYTYISNIPSLDLVRRSDTSISVGTIALKCIYLSEAFELPINTNDIYYEYNDMHIKIPCTTNNPELTECVLSEQFDLSILEDNTIQLSYRDSCGEFKKLSPKPEVYKIKIGDPLYINLSEDPKTVHEITIEVSTNSLESIHLSAKIGEIPCANSKQSVFTCSVTLELLETKPLANFIASININSETYKTKFPIVVVYDTESIDLSTEKQNYTIDTPTNDSLQYNYTFKNVINEIKDIPGNKVREIKLESNSVLSYIDECTIDDTNKALVKCTYYAPENSTNNFYYKNAIGEFSLLGNVTVGSGSPIYYDSSSYSKINILFLFVFILIF